jgi:5S rRNA maturation endonuclease (ribonuclease M5)
MTGDQLASIMPELARHFWGEPNPARSTRTELRWGGNGARSVDLAKGAWFDFEANEGGGVLDLLKREHVAEPWQWLRENGFAEHRNNGAGARPNIVATYDYTDEHGDLLSQVVRLDPKTFRQRRPARPDDPPDRVKDGWIWNVKGVRQVPFRLPELIEALALERRVFIVEGEKDVLTLAHYNITATCNAGGAGKWRDEFAELLAGADVVILPDNDAPGHDHAGAVARSLAGNGAHIRVVELPDLPDKNDVSDWFAAGGTVEAFNDLVEMAADWTPDAAKPNGATATAGLAVWNAGRDVELPPPRGWLLGNSFCRRLLSSLLGTGGVGKSALRVLQALALASNRDLTGEHIFQRTRVLIVSLEDDADELRRRVLAARLHHDIAAEEVDGWLFLSAPGGTAGKLMLLDARAGRAIVGELAAHIEAAVEQFDIGLVILDPYIKAHGIPENDNNSMDAVAGLLNDLAARLDIAIDVPHHTTKGVADPGNADRGRGASATINAARLAYTISTMSTDEAGLFNISEEDRRAYVRLDRAKLNVARTTGPATWFKLIGIRLNNGNEAYPAGDEVQTVEPWSPPSTWADLSIEIINVILDQFSLGLPDGQRFSNAPAAGEERAAWKLVQSYCRDKSEKQCRTIVHTWLESGLLFPKQYDDPVQRKKRSGLFVADEKRPGRMVADENL